MHIDDGDQVDDVGVARVSCLDTRTPKRARLPDLPAETSPVSEPNFFDASSEHARALCALCSVALGVDGRDVATVSAASVTMADCSNILMSTANSLGSDKLPASRVYCTVLVHAHLGVLVQCYATTIHSKISINPRCCERRLKTLRLLTFR